MQEFIQLLQEVFPSVDPFTAERARSALNSFLGGRSYVELANPPFEPYLCQGDVVSSLHFSIIDDEGNLVENKFSGMLLSHTCDAVRDETVVFAACYPSEDYFQNASANVDEIKRNRISTMFFLPDCITRHIWALNAFRIWAVAALDLGTSYPCLTTPWFDSTPHPSVSSSALLVRAWIRRWIYTQLGAIA